MGAPRKQRKKYHTPPHPWNKTRIEEEKALLNEYGLKNKKELWKMKAILTRFKRQAKNLIGVQSEQAEKEVAQFLEKLAKMNLVDAGSRIEDVLDLDTKDILERRLQTLLYRSGRAKSIKQARQFIIHGHVIVRDKKVTVPSKLLTAEEANMVNFIEASALSDPEHPERIVRPKEVVSTIEEAPAEMVPMVSKEEKKEEAPKEEVKKDAPKEGGKK